MAIPPPNISQPDLSFSNGMFTYTSGTITTCSYDNTLNINSILEKNNIYKSASDFISNKDKEYYKIIKISSDISKEYEDYKIYTIENIETGEKLSIDIFLLTNYKNVTLEYKLKYLLNTL